MNFLQIYLLIGALILTLMTALWLLSLALRNASIVDIFWGLGFVIVNAFTFSLGRDKSDIDARHILLLALVTVWGLRLSLHIFLRNHGKPEDFRYATWRTDHGQRWWWVSFFQVFALQGLLMWIIATSLIAAQASNTSSSLTALDFLGAAFWIIGFFSEAVGDWQLTRFKANPENKGKLLTTGLWRFTRHPNYFGDAAQWWGYFLIAEAAGSWWTFFSPILMTFLLMHISGVTLLEKTLKETKPGYEEYIRRTSAFIPWLPKSG